MEPQMAQGMEERIPLSACSAGSQPPTPHSALQLGYFADLQFDPKGKEESICAKN